MKAAAFLLVLALAGCVSSAHFAWKTGKQYNYGVIARLFSGQSDINTQYAGLELNYKIVLTVIGPNTLHLKPENVKGVELNSVLKGGWRDAELENETPAEISAQLQRYLESPIQIQMNQGIIESIKVESYLPTWAVNIKKAQASHFVANTAGVNSVIRGNLNRQTNSVRSEEANQESGFFYETMEETVHGECETYYTVSQNGPFDWPNEFEQEAQAGLKQQQQQQQQQNDNNSNESGQQDDDTNDSIDQQDRDSDEVESARRRFQYAAFNRFNRRSEFGSSSQESQEENYAELPWPKTFSDFCAQNDQVYEIIKSVNFTACKNKPTLAYTTLPGVYDRAGDNAMGSGLTRALITRYLACGQDRKQYTILKIKQEEQINTGIRLDQKTMAGTSVNITLLSVQQAQQVEQIKKSKTIKGLSYTFDPKEQELQRQGKINNAFSDDLEENDDNEQNNDSNSQEQNQRSGRTTQRPAFEGSDSQQSSSDEENEIDNENQRIKWSNYKRFIKTTRPRFGSRRSSDENENESQEQQSREETYKTEAENAGPLPKPDLQNAPLSPLMVSPLQSSGMQKRAVALMEEIKSDILSDKSMAEAEVLSKISTVAKIVRQLNYAQILDLYHQLASKSQTEEDQVSRNVFLDTVSIAGTNPAILVQADLINKGEIQGEEAAQLISVIPMYVRTPTKAFIQQLFKTLVESSALENNLQGKTTAQLAFSNLVYQAWVDGRIKNSRYPVALYGEFGNHKDAQRLYAKYFVKNLKQALRKEQSEGHNKHWTITYLKSLGNLGVPEVIPMVQQILDQSNDPYIKTHAIFALSRMIISHSAVNIPVTEIQSDDRQAADFLTDEFVEKQVMPILVSAAFDKGEHPETRMAAASLLVYTTSADTAIWQQMAYSTWFETSQEVHSFIYSTLKSLAQVDQEGVSGALYNANQQARAVLALAKPITPGYAKSRNTFHAGFVQYLQSAYSHQFSYFGSKDSNVPNYIHYRNQLQYANNGFGVTPVQFSAYGHTVQKLASFAFKQLKMGEQQLNQNDNDSQGQSDENQEAHQYFEQIRSLLGIERRHQEEDIEGSIDIKIRNEMQRFFSVNEDDIEKWYKQAVANLPQLMSTGFQINYQKTWHAVEHSFEMPTAMGVPVSYAFRVPVHLSIRGTLKLAVDEGLGNVQLQAELHPVYAYKTHAHLAIKVPFTGNKYQSGIQRHVVVETPFRAFVQKAPGGQIVIAVTPSQLVKGTPSGQIPIATFHQIPYTSIVTDSLWPTNHKEGGQMSVVHAADFQAPSQYKGSFGQNALGLTFEYQEESEYQDQNQGQSGWINFWKQFHSQSCLFNLGWLGGEKVRYVQRTLVLDVSKSQTKTLVLTLGGKREQSPTAKDLWEDSSSQSSQSTEESASSESKQDSSSQQQDSNERDNQSSDRSSRQRQQENRRRESGSSVHSAEDNSQGGLVIAAALIGKQTPVRSIQDGVADVQHILASGSPSTVQYLVQVSRSSGRIYVRAAIGDGANEAAKSLPQAARSLEAIRKAIINSPNTKSQPAGCAEFEGEYDAPKYANRGQLVVLRKRLLDEDLTVKVKGELQFGRSCSKMPHEVKLQGKLQRGHRQTEFAQTKSRQAQKCAEDEKKGFYVSPVCMQIAEQQAAALNQGDFQITYTDMPKALVNRTDDIEDLAKAVLYPYMSNDRFHDGAGDNNLRVEYFLSPNKEFLDVHITKPHSKLIFESIRTNRVIRAALPFTATQSLANNLRDRAFRADSDPSCSIQGNFVNTFDNVTYRFSDKAGDNCYHVLTQDCSGRKQVSVLVKDVASDQKKVVILLEAKTKIELTPQAAGQQQSNRRIFQNDNSRFQVDINDVRIETLPRIVRSQQTGQEIARVESTVEGGIQIFSEHVDLSTNGDYVIVFAANHLRNRSCGICGDFNGEKTGEMKSPQNCPMSSGSALVASYAIQPQALNPKEEGPGKCQVDSKLKKQIEQENSQCQSESGNAPSRQRKYSNAKVGVSTKCIDDILTAIRKASYTTVDAVLKICIDKAEIRHRYANKIADKVVKEAEEFLEHEDSAQQLAQLVGTLTANMFQRYHPSMISDRLARVMAKLIKPALTKVFLLVINPFCEKSQCCYPSRHASYSSAEIEEDIQFVTADSADSDEDSNDDIPFLGAESRSQSCQTQLEDKLATGVSKVVHLALQSDASTNSSKRKEIAMRVFREVRKSIGKAMKDKEEIVQSILDAIERVAPNTYQQLITPIIQDITRHSIRGLQQARNCKFEGIVQDN